jgi:hypothetical protein
MLDIIEGIRKASLEPNAPRTSLSLTNAAKH